MPSQPKYVQKLTSKSPALMKRYEGTRAQTNSLSSAPRERQLAAQELASLLGYAVPTGMPTPRVKHILMSTED